ncbi:MAG: tyrosine-protein phosphatase [Oscillospiraceae bacterium]|nr:tyrosine-protein phosphatase [Oscillospiraceae bacterium]
MRMIRKALSMLLVLCMLCGAVTVSGFCQENAGAEELRDCPVLHETEFGGMYITATIDEFNALGYRYGDSVDIVFSNGYRLEDQPYFNGYYTPTGQSLLVAYPGYPYIRAGINNGDDLWILAGLTENDTATITLREHGKYLDIQMARDIHYTDDRSDYASDEVFANFRSVNATGIAPGMLYRSASPCDNQHNRAPIADALIESAGVNCILNLADDEEEIAAFLSDESYSTPYFRSLYENGQVIPTELNTNFTSDAFMQKLAAGLSAMAEQEGPYLVHCAEGKDRTGFVCLLLEALCGADYEEIVEDYMITYSNYYGITPASDPARYTAIVRQVLDPMVLLLAGDGDTTPEEADLAAGARSYLLAAGMDKTRIDRLIDRLGSAAG